MLIKPKISDILMYQILNPVLLLFMLGGLFIYGFSIYSTILLFLSLDFVYNMFTLIVAYNSVEIKDSNITITRLFGRKYTMTFGELLDIERSGFQNFVGLKAYDKLVLELEKEKKKVIYIYRGAIQDEDFSKLETNLKNVLSKN